MNLKFTVFVVSYFIAHVAVAQQDTMNMKGMPKDTSKIKSSKMNMDMDGMDMNGMKMNMDSNAGMKMMSDPVSKNLPMQGHGSGTTWLPDASPMNAYMFHSKKWMYMLHGNLFVRYNEQDFSHEGVRGGEKFDAPNWIMLMGQRSAGEKGLFHFTSMLSLDPITIGAAGYPLLFQSGEDYKGTPLVDKQHPHDFFSELSVSYSYSFSKKTDAFVYVGYPGEPALGPVAFMHRPSAQYNPDAPLSHHWSDATHITFGVATLGIRLGNIKIDGSLFTGREPDDNRYNFDKPTFDSYSGRISFNPNDNVSLQVSHGFIKSPEELHPDEDVNRTTASVIYSKPLKNNSFANVSLIYGLNKIKNDDGENSILFEPAFTVNRWGLYGRYEYVQKSTEELALNPATYGSTLFNINAYTIGLNYNFITICKTNTALGSQFTYNVADAKLISLYGKHPMAFEVYVKIYPALMKM